MISTHAMNVENALLNGKNIGCWVVLIDNRLATLFREDPNFNILETTDEFTYFDGTPITGIVCRLGDIIFAIDNTRPESLYFI